MAKKHKDPEPVAPSMTIEMWPIDRPVPYARNPRRIPQSAIDKTSASLKEFGWQQAIVVDDEDVILAGHTRLLAAQKLGMTEVPVKVASGLSKAACRAYRIADNRTGREATDNSELLALELEDLKADEYDLLLTALDEDEIAALEAIGDSTAEGLTDEDDVPEPPKDPISRLGDLWILGKHRLLCGDSTSIDAVEKLMDGKKADMVFTDPPYNVDYNPDAAPTNSDKRRKKNPLGTIKSDKMSDDDFLAFLRGVVASMVLGSKPGAVAYVCHADSEGLNFRTAFQEAYVLSSVLIWAKNNFSIGRKDYHWMHEPILYGWALGNTHTYYGDRSQTSIWRISKDDVNSYVHPTQKPVELIEKAVNNSSQSGQIVFDLFGGSGSTLIACEKTGRIARLMELDPKYVDVICQRFCEFTGKSAIRQNDGASFMKLKALADGTSLAA